MADSMRGSSSRLLRSFIVIVLTALALARIAAPAYGQNLIPNASMEQALPAWTSNNPQSADNPGAVVGFFPRTALNSIRLIHDGVGGEGQPTHNHEVWQQNIPIAGIAAGVEYTFRIYVNTGGTTISNPGGCGGCRPLAVLRWKTATNGFWVTDAPFREMYMWAPFGSYAAADNRFVTVNTQAPPNAAKIDVGVRTWSGVPGPARSYWDDAELVVRQFPERGSLLASYEAENSTNRGGVVVATAIPGFQGTGYLVDATPQTKDPPFHDNSGGFVEWNNVDGGATGGPRVISLRYSNEGTVPGMTLRLNGAVQGAQDLIAAATGNRASWATHDWRVSLNPGNNTVRIDVASFNYAGHHLDKINVWCVTGTSGCGGAPLPPPSTVASPAFDPNGGTFASPTNVTITTATAGAMIYYTTDGSTPSASAIPYSGPIPLNSTTTLRAIGVLSGLDNSSVTSAAFTFNGGGGGGQTPYGGVARVASGRIEAEDYDVGGQGVAFNDTTTGNAGGAYRSDNVDLWGASGTGVVVGAAPTGEWLEYTINVPSSGQYTLGISAATPVSGRQLRILIGGADVTGVIAMPNTGGFTNYQTVTKTVSLNAGTQVMRLEFATGGSINVDYIELTADAAPPPPPPPPPSGQQPFGGTAWALPGVVQAEDYDTGGQSVAYNDTTAGNQGNVTTRSDGVDLWTSGSAVVVGNIATGEWLEYTVNVPVAGAYKVGVSATTPYANRQVRVLLNGADTGALTLPSNGNNWAVYQTVTKTVNLAAGQQIMRLEIPMGGSINVDFVSVAP